MPFCNSLDYTHKKTGHFSGFFYAYEYANHYFITSFLTPLQFSFLNLLKL